MFTVEVIGSTTFEDSQVVTNSGPQCVTPAMMADGYLTEVAGSLSVTLPLPGIEAPVEDDGTGHATACVVCVAVSTRIAWMFRGVFTTGTSLAFNYVPSSLSVDPAIFTFTRTLTNGAFYSLSSLGGPCSGQPERLTYSGIGGLAAVMVSYRIRSDRQLLVGAAPLERQDYGGTGFDTDIVMSADNPVTTNGFIVPMAVTTPGRSTNTTDNPPFRGAEDWFPLTTLSPWDIQTATASLNLRESLVSGYSIAVFDSLPTVGSTTTPLDLDYSLHTTLPYPNNDFPSEAVQPFLSPTILGSRIGILEGDLVRPVSVCPPNLAANAVAGPLRVSTDPPITIRLDKAGRSLPTLTATPR